MTDTVCDVLVVGGGPSGSTISALLAQRGENVVVVEKDTHPRFHIGESLLPFNVPLLEKLGVKLNIDKIGITKYGVEFNSPWHDGVSTLDFAQSWDKSLSYAYEVRRSEFDETLFRHAAAQGAATIEGCRITEVTFPPEGGIVATGTGSDGEKRVFRAKFLVDASGRDTLLAGKYNLKQRNRDNSTAAVFAHFTGARRLPGKAEGNISLFWFDHGWFWFIPLLDGTTSIGAVCHSDFMKTRGTDVTTFLRSLIDQCPMLKDRLANAEMTGPATATGNYSYRAERISGPNYIMVGDAFSFIDPVFSSGVYLAMKTAFLGADVVTACLHKPKPEADRAIREFDTQVRRALDRFSWFIYRINTPAIRELFMRHGNPLRMREAVLALLSGDVFGHSPIHFRLFLFKCVFYIKGFFLRLSERRGTRPAAGGAPAARTGAT